MSPGDGEALRVQLLGPVRAWRGGRELTLGPQRQQAVFAILAMRVNEPVSRDELIDGVWGEGPPASAVNGIHICVFGLRRVLEPGRARRAPGCLLMASGNGYLLKLSPGNLDVWLFEQHLARARQERAAADHDAAVRSLDAALLLWQAVPLSGISGPWAEIERARLTDLRLTAIEDRNDAMLAFGRHGDVVAQLAALVREHPLRERFRGQLMLALYRCGRQAEALDQYAETRRVLVEELGIEPGPQLRRLHGKLLASDPDLECHPATAIRAAARSAAVPRELPAGVSSFTGRRDELAELDGTLTRGADVRILLVCGTAGAGKTALAVRWAHKARDLFPDGQLYIDLRGYDCDQPVCATDALAGFLRSLGVTGDEIPAGLDERSARFRSLADGRHLLILLDNAASLEQVRPLLPGTPSCTVLVTSRDRLAGLVARHGARRLDLDPLPPADALALLRILIGDRVDAEPAAAATLAAQCSRLPLALRVAAELAAIRRAMPLERLADELADEQKRLDLLDADGDARTAVRAVLSWSCRHLTGDAARAFRLLSLHPAPGFGPDAAAALLGSTLEQAGHLLDALTSAHLVQPVRDGRYGMHDLLRAYARSLAQEDDTREPLRRMLDYYLAAAAAAMDHLDPAERHARPPAPDFADAAAARAWLDAERATLSAITALAAVNAWPQYATRLAATLFRYFDGGHSGDAVLMHSHARHAALQAGDRAAEAAALCDLGVAEWRLGRMSLATGHHREALAISRNMGDRAGQARALGNLGLVCWQQGRYQDAARHFRQAQALFRQVGDQTGEARSLTNRGIIDWQHGRHCAAARHHERALALYRELGNRHGEACVLGNLGSVYLAQRRFPAAAELQQQALDLFRDLGNQVGEARAMSDLGAVYQQQGLLPTAADQLRQALVQFRDLGYRAGETEALIRLGEVQLAADQAREAQAHFMTALGLSAQLGQVYEQGRAHLGLGRCHRNNGDPGQAREHWELALALFTQLGLPDADEARASLATLETAQRPSA